MTLDDILSNTGPIVVHGGIIYKSSKLKTDMEISKKGKSYYFLEHGRANDVECRAKGRFDNLDTFVNDLLMPLLNLSDLESEKWKNSFFDAITPKENPLYIGNNNYMIFSRRSGDFSVTARHKGDLFGLAQKGDTINPKMNFMSNELCFGVKDSPYKAKKSEHGYTIEVVHPTLDLKYQNCTYRFNNIGLRIELTKRFNRYIFQNPSGFENVKHPFIFECGKICFNGDTRWSLNGINFTHTALSTELAYQIRQTFKITERMLENGYKKGCSPVRDIKNFKNARVA